jgi:hypothetical protein
MGGAFIVLVRMLAIGPPDELRSIVLVGTEELARRALLTRGPAIPIPQAPRA